MRNANIEVFRCLLMFFIVLYHCLEHGVYNESPHLWKMIFSALLMWHVDGFIAISGWFGIKWSVHKWFNLFSIILFYSLISLFYDLKYGVGINAIKNFRVDAGWFGGTYIMLMMVSPLLNTLIETLRKLPAKMVLEMWGLFALAMILSWAPFGLFTGVQACGTDGYTITTFVFIYFTVRLIRIFECPIYKRHVIGVVCAFVVMTLALEGAVYSGFVDVSRHCKNYGEYNAPQVWGMAIVLMLFFARKARFPNWIGRMARFVGPSMFGVYLCHDVTVFGRKIYFMPEYWFSQHPIMPPFCVVVVCAIYTFIVCVGIDLCRRIMFVIFRKYILTSNVFCRLV